MEKSKIQWTDATWNVAVGCGKVDTDCKFCYMFRGSMNNTRYLPTVIRRTKTVFNLPVKLKEPSRIFTSSLTDFFHEGIDTFRNEAWDIIRKCPQHTFQILTKRPERIKDNLPEFWDEIKYYCHIGTSVGSAEGIHRIITLQSIQDIPVKFLSLEPLHESIDLISNGLLEGIDWVIVGGESGNETGKYKYRPCNLDWIRTIVDQCTQNNVPVFVKQLGTYLSKEMGLKDRHGGNIDEFPTNLQVRQFPHFIINVANHSNKFHDAILSVPIPPFQKEFTGYFDDNINGIYVGDCLKNKYGYTVVVYKDENGNYLGKLVCNEDHSCKDIPYGLNGGRGFTKTKHPNGN